MNERNTEEKYYSFEEYKMIYESAEKVTDRRLSRNNQNYSICVGIVFAIAIIANWTFSQADNSYIGFSLIFAISLIAAFFTILWLRQIEDFKSLNKAKFSVLNQMSPLLKFNHEKHDGEIISFEPFRKEWEILTIDKALEKNNKLGFLALKSTNEELFTPKAFFTLFIITGLLSLITIVFHLSSFITTWENLLFLP